MERAQSYVFYSCEPPQHRLPDYYAEMLLDLPEKEMERFRQLYDEAVRAIIHLMHSIDEKHDRLLHPGVYGVAAVLGVAVACAAASLAQEERRTTGIDKGEELAIRMSERMRYELSPGIFENFDKHVEIRVRMHPEYL